jgi:hypothetical protein
MFGCFMSLGFHLAAMSIMCNNVLFIEQRGNFHPHPWHIIWLLCIKIGNDGNDSISGSSEKSHKMLILFSI